MLIKVEAITGFELSSLDGVFGQVEQIYFDDRQWVVHHVAADTGPWLAGRRVLISPYVLGDVSEAKRQIEVVQTKKQIEGCPAITSDQPISLQYEMVYYGYHGWPGRWAVDYPVEGDPKVIRQTDGSLEPGADTHLWDPHLRSTDTVRGYHVGVNGNRLGHIVDIILDGWAWTLRYLVVDTKDYWPARKVLISTQWVDKVDWNDSTVNVALTRDLIKGSPKFSEELLLRRDYEAALHRHYDRQGYWETEAVSNGRPS